MMNKKCKECGKIIGGKNANEFIDETKDGDIHYHLDCAEKIGLYKVELGYCVEYDYPSLHATGEEVRTMAEAEKIFNKRIKEGYINVRIEPLLVKTKAAKAVKTTGKSKWKKR